MKTAKEILHEQKEIAILNAMNEYAGEQLSMIGKFYAECLFYQTRYGP